MAVSRNPWSCSRFNTQPPEGGWLIAFGGFLNLSLFQHTAARRRLVFVPFKGQSHTKVSTHSRPKAAGVGLADGRGLTAEVSTHSRPKAAGIYQWQPSKSATVSTHSRPKAAGTC